MVYFVVLLISLLSANTYAQPQVFKPYQCEGNASFIYADAKASLTTLKYFGTSISIDIYHDNEQQALTALCQGLNVIQQYHYLASNFSTYPYFTNIKTINNAPEKIHPIDPRLTELLASSLEWHQLTQGRFNVALSPVLAVWRQYRNECKYNQDCRLPSDSELLEASQYIDIKDIKLDTANNTIQMKPGMQLDLGGIAKGWMVEKVYDRLRAENLSSFIINAGGNIRHFGLHPQGRPFITAIEDPIQRKSNYTQPHDGAIYHEFIQGEDITVVSSGNYLNYFSVNGKEYHHIIDPTTLYPKAEGVAVSVIMQANAILADVISTSLFLMPQSQAQQWLEDLGLADSVAAIWYLNASGDKIYSKEVSRYLVQP
ncbi:FAD:protein FMN transferase [Shewanella sp. NIFS-20-20]|uniref:FAD:protein FMN transferase n=1 Tax=Shewanella sp. NIFS-20-20 TaxID=2853806 RepID=UPI001C46ACE0|nr:FAD:protein FMN transferase [Shewanella sp. NIFS-20-20]MBV7314638.1 FAD:protein FMN transferase [Shewanella sp. NIFS-20-20]